MSETPTTDPDDQENGRQSGVGKTGGLPGHHADPATRLPTEDDTVDTVAGLDVAVEGDDEPRG